MAQALFIKVNGLTGPCFHGDDIYCPPRTRESRIVISTQVNQAITKNIRLSVD
jgi:hypothetical protein